MHGVIRFVPIGQVAGGVAAISRSCCQVVVVIGVAFRALHVGMRIGQWETSAGVIERRVRPSGGAVARGALRHREAGGDVIGDVAAKSLGAVPILEVAGGVAAVRRLNRQRVVVIDVAGHARSRRG